MTGEDRPQKPCEPVCDVQQFAGTMAVCPACGSLWTKQQVTEVDPVTFQPTRIVSHAWVRR